MKVKTLFQSFVLALLVFAGAFTVFPVSAKPISAPLQAGGWNGSAYVGLRAPFASGTTFTITGDRTTHGGTNRHAVDIGMNQQTVLAMYGGKVLAYKPNNGLAGNELQIDHEDGYCSTYLHLKSVNVKKGDPVKQGDPIAVSGNTSSSALAYHLHVEVDRIVNGSCNTDNPSTPEVPMYFDEIPNRELNKGDRLTSQNPPDDICSDPSLCTFGNNAYARQFFDQGKERLNLEVCADNLAGKTLYVKSWRNAGFLPDQSAIATGNCITFWNLDGAGAVFTDVPYRTWVSIGNWPDTNWGVPCLEATGRTGMCTQAQYPNESKDPVAPQYGAVWISQSPYPTVVQGQSADMSVVFKNIGTTTWSNVGDTPARIATTNPANNQPDFITPFICPDWLGGTRPAAMSESTVAPGDTGTFNFKICVPSDMAPGIYRFSVAPLIEYIGWMIQPGITVYWDITVTKKPDVPSVSTAVNPKSIAVGGTSIATVSLANIPAEGYLGAEFTCTYNAALVEVSKITGTNLFGEDAVTAVNGPKNGSFIFALVGSKGNKTTTNGGAFTFNLKGLQAGETAVECKARVSNGGDTLTDISSAGVTVIVDPQSDGKLTGQVLACKPVTIRLNNTDFGPFPDGAFSLTAPAGTYPITASAAGFLSAQGSATLTSGKTTNMPTIILLAGDIDGNDVVDQFDAMTIGMGYNTAVPTAADLNCDNTINFFDLELLARNYRTVGPIAWQ